MLHQKVTEAVNHIKSKTSHRPDIGLILGSGLGNYADEISDSVYIPYEEIPNFPKSTVKSHAGRLVIGYSGGQCVCAMQGRVHFYEGYSMEEVTFPVRVMKELGCRSVIITNASGGINRQYHIGDFMLISDHINFMGTNPLVGSNHESWGVRFPDMTDGYCKDLMKLAEHVAREINQPVRKGIYIGVTGPSFETPAEIRFFERIGADAVGMSTVPEVIVANHMGMKVLGISCITNMAAGILNQKITSQEVIDTARRVRPDFTRLITGILQRWK